MPFGESNLPSGLVKRHITDRLVAGGRVRPILVIKRIGKAVVGILHFKDAVVFLRFKGMLAP